jgi:hypothetical protein
MPSSQVGYGGQLIGEYCDFLSDHIQQDSAQWRIWQVAGQFFQSEETGGESPRKESYIEPEDPESG